MERKSKTTKKTAPAKTAKAKTTKAAKTVVVSGKPKWKKITRGTLYPFPKQRNRRVKPNEVIEATEAEIAKYRDQFVLVKEGTGVYKPAAAPKPAEPEKPKDEKPPVKEVYEISQISDDRFNVVSAAGKVMNDEELSLGEAQALKKSLEEETPE